MRIRPSDYPDWNDYYWQYQHILAKDYLIPMLEKAGFTTENKRILEIGCGNGGVIETMAEKAETAVGIDIREFDRSRHATGKVRYITADVFDPDKRNLYSGSYDLIVLRDVIEHLPDKHAIFRLFDELLSDEGILFLTFPPYYSPFGAHQQVFSRTLTGKLPYIHWLPGKLYLKWVSFFEKNNPPAYELALAMEQSKTTIRQMLRFIKEYKFRISHRYCYFVRPSYEIRYGLKPRRDYVIQYIPLLREILILGVYLIIKRFKNH